MKQILVTTQGGKHFIGDAKEEAINRVLNGEHNGLMLHDAWEVMMIDAQMQTGPNQTAFKREYLVLQYGTAMEALEEIFICPAIMMDTDKCGVKDHFDKIIEDTNHMMQKKRLAMKGIVTPGANQAPGINMPSLKDIAQGK